MRAMRQSISELVATRPGIRERDLLAELPGSERQLRALLLGRRLERRDGRLFPRADAPVATRAAPWADRRLAVLRGMLGRGAVSARSIDEILGEGRSIGQDVRADLHEIGWIAIAPGTEARPAWIIAPAGHRALAESAGIPLETIIRQGL